MAVLSAAYAALVGRAELLPGAGRLLELHRRELPQKDELCGPFCALLALRAAGVESRDQDEVAVAAGTVLSPPPWTGSLPPGEHGREDFRLPLPQAGAAADAGTSAVGVAAAVERLSGGALVAVPASGHWTPDRLRRLLDLVARSETPIAVLANIATAELWDPGTHPDSLLRYLQTGSDAGGAPQRWQVGHFVTLVGRLDGAAGTLVLVADGYPSLGAEGLHLQPLPRVAAALRREGTAPGGILLVVPAAHRGDAADRVRASGLRTALWDNGSPVPPSAAEHPPGG